MCGHVCAQMHVCRYMLHIHVFTFKCMCAHVFCVRRVCASAFKWVTRQSPGVFPFLTMIASIPQVTQACFDVCLRADLSIENTHLQIFMLNNPGKCCVLKGWKSIPTWEESANLIFVVQHIDRPIKCFSFSFPNTYNPIKRYVQEDWK